MTQHRTALVVGSGGIGGQVCRVLADSGHRVHSTYRSGREAAEQLQRELGEASGGCSALDVTDPESVRAATTAAREQLGRIDVLVVTVGHRHDFALFVDTPAETAQEILAHELGGVLEVVRAVLPWQLEEGYGRIVLVGSDSAKAGSLGDSVSSAARGGLVSFARSLARETAREDITANVVCPGPTETGLLEDMRADDGLTGKVMAGMLRSIPKGRAGRPEEIAAAIAFLASPEAGFITGQALSVSGGLTMS